MNFLCDQCKQKYHVADDKVRGRSVTRFRCKKCNHVIELRAAGGVGGDPSGGAVIEDLSHASELPRSVPPPSAPAGRLPTAPAPLGARPAAARPAAAPAAPSQTRAPLGAANRLPTAPATALSRGPTSAGAPRAAAPSPAAPSPVARPAAPRPASLGTAGASSAAARAPGAAPRPAAAPSPAARTGTSSALRSGLANKPSDVPPRSGGSSASALLNASETGWYAGVRDVPVGPLTRSELANKIESGDITPDSLVWREGLDDWRPLRNVDELSDLVRAAAQRMSGVMLGTMGRRDSTPAGAAAKVVPLASSRGGARAADAAGESIGDDEPTRMSALADLVAKAEEEGMVTSPPAASPAANKPFVAAPRPSAALAPPPSAAVSPPAAAPSIHDATQVTASPFPTITATEATVPPATAAAPALSIPPAAVPSVAPPAGNASSRRAGGIPIGLWLMMAGVGVTGVAVGLFLRPGAGAPPASSVTAPAAMTAPVAGPTVAANTPPVPAAPAVAPTPVAPTESPSTARPRSTGSSHPVGGGSASGGRQQTAAQRALLAQLDNAGGSFGPTTSELRNAPQPSAGGGLTGSARAGQVLGALQRNGSISSCWNTVLRRNPGHAAERITVQLDVSATGRASVTVRGAQDPELASCIQNRARAAPYGAGGSVSAETSINLAPGG